jgi:hypothetical protein
MNDYFDRLKERFKTNLILGAIIAVIALIFYLLSEMF